jgi:thymidylate synthase ThyX
MYDNLTHYISNKEDNVFLVRNLPQEVVAVLFAYYSRSPNGLRENLAKLLADKDIAVLPVGDVRSSTQEDFALANSKAAAFHQKYVIGYGHRSVAEHSKLSLGVESVSILTAKEIEDCRLGSYTEKSTRYVEFNENSFYQDIDLPADLKEEYLGACRFLMRTYIDIIKKTTDALKKQYPGNTENQYKTKAFDLCRGLLPASTLTNLGVTLNGTTAEHHFCKLLSSNLPETRAIAKKMVAESMLEIPTLLKYVAPNVDHTAALDAVRQIHHDRWPESNVSHRGRAVLKLEWPTSPMWRLATHILLEARPDLDYAEARFRTSLESNAREIIDAYLLHRGGHENVGRPFESLTYAFEILCDYGAWRDLQRHRMLSQTIPLLTCNEGVTIDPILVELGLYLEIFQALDSVKPTWKKLADVNQYTAQYVVPLAYNVRYYIRANLRELFHLCELRSKKEGHTAYRMIAQAIAAEIIDDCPFLSPYLHVDRNKYTFAR